MVEAGPQRVAAIDCGTNSLRLLIADLDPVRSELTDLHRRMEIVRLGQGVDATGRLAPEALARTFAMLGEYEQTIHHFGVHAIRLVATSATRDASNAAEFSAGVREILGVDPEVVSGLQEAYLSFSGATAELVSPAGSPAADPAGTRPEPPFLVVDIGGGSTEFVFGAPDADAAHGLSVISVNLGSVRLTERYLLADPPTSAQVEAATAEIDSELSEVAAAIPVSRARTLVGLAGSVTTLTAVALDLPAYDAARVHHARIPAARIHEVTTDLLGTSHAERARHGAIHPGRLDVIGAGALILDRIMNRFAFTEMVASEHDILDGIAWSLVRQ